MGSNNKIRYHLRVAELQSLFNILSSQNYQNVGPTARDGAIMLENLNSFDDLAVGYSEEQDKGSYRLVRQDEESFFQYTLGPQSFKKFLHPPKRKLWSANGSNNEFTVSTTDHPSKMAFWGVRSCDLAAINILDRVFLKGPVVNNWYKQAREELFIIAVGCTQPSANCFCTSMNSGPMPEENFDISLVEVIQNQKHFFIAEIRSEKALAIVKKLNFQEASEEDIRLSTNSIDKAREQMPIRIEAEAAPQILKDNLESKHWDEVAKRCLSCANCTMVCPTCFCSTTEDITDISGDHTERWLRWDSCFNGDFSYIHGGRIRNSTRSRYRQWMTHKLSSWHDQFGTSGCVGCGRCIAWCPVGIDITEELKALNNQKTNEKRTLEQLSLQST